jgi:triacylglycerol lipase
VHGGFNLAYTAVATDLWTYLCKEEWITRLCLTGHSLGGALATLAYMDIAVNWYRYVPEKRRKPPMALFTFGSPRVGSSDFAKAFDSIRALGWGTRAGHSYRVVNGWDPVPWLPFKSMVYTHVKDAIWIGDTFLHKLTRRYHSVAEYRRVVEQTLYQNDNKTL